MGPSQTLRREHINPWLTEICAVEEELNMLLSLIGAELYAAGSKAMNELTSDPAAHPHVRAWPSVFSGISVISNRKTLAHRDQGGWPQCYDLLLAAGNYSNALFSVPDVGAEFQYNPGTVVAICGKVLRHAVYDWSGGERLCYAHFMRNNVHNRLQVKQTSWSSMQLYESCMSRKFIQRMQQL